MVKIYIFEITSSICDKDKSFFLSELDSSEIKALPSKGGKNIEDSLIGMTLAKKVISIETLSPQNHVIIGKTMLGKPIIRSPEGLNFDISISHSGDYWVIGICDSGKIGVDVEQTEEIDFNNFRNCLSVSEENYINSGKKKTQRLKNFYEIWTRKEAYSKAIGIGLQKPLPITQFYPNQIKPREEIRCDEKTYYYSTLKKDKFVLSVCTTKSESSYLKYAKLNSDKIRSFIDDGKMTFLYIKNR